MRGSGPRIAVLICAYSDERWSHLRGAVRAVGAQSRPADELVVVIDHNAALERRAARELGGARVVANSGRQGLAAARNCGVAQVDADVVAFLDDDAEPESHWLARLADAYADPAVLGAGGEIEPSWERGRPWWFPQEFDWVVGCTYRGMPDVVAPVRNLIGANMSARRSVLELVRGFSEDLGRVGADVAGTEETDLCIRAAAAQPGGLWLYVPAARVHHHVPAARSSLRYFLRRCRGEGRSKAAMSASVGSANGLASERRYVARTLPAGAVRHLRDAVVERRPATAARSAVLALGLLATAWGYLRGRLAGSRGSLATNSAALMATTVLNLLLGFAFWAIAARAYPAAEVGEASAAISAMMLVSLLSGLGAGPALVARLPQRRAGWDWSLSLNANLALGAASGLAAGAAAALALPALAGFESSTGWMAAFACGTALWSMSTALDYAFIAERASGLMTARNVVLGGLKLPLLALPLWAAAQPSERLFGAWVAASALALSFGLLLLAPRLGRAYAPALRGVFAEGRAMGRTLAGNHLVTIGNAVPMLALPIVVAERLSAAEGAYFYVTWMLGGGLFMISSAVGSALFAEVSHVPEQVRSRVRSGVLITAALSVPAMLVLVLGGRGLLGLFGSDYAAEGATLLLLLVACALPDAVTNLAVAVLRVTGHLTSAARLTLGMAAATLGGTWLLLPELGLAAPGVAFLGAQVAGSAWVLARLRRRRAPRCASPAPRPAVQLSRGR